MSLLTESKRFNDFTPEEKRQIFNVFTQSYIKATGTSWDERKFYNRANEWLFFGDPNGFITVRPQQSGYYKLTGVAGNPKSIIRALQELTATHYPIWGMLTQDLANMLTKKFGFRLPNRLESFVISKLITNNVFGNVDFKRNSDGSITFNYADVGEATKVFVGNREYYKKVRMDTLKKVFTRKPATNEEINEEVLTEKRAISDYYEDSFKLVSEYLRRYGYENTYASFRKTANTSFINRHNSYSTPTGFYMYPLKNFAEKIAQTTDMKTFMQVFPYTPDSKFCFLFTINNYDKLLSSLNIDVEKIHEYVRKIKEVYGKQKPSIATLCDNYFSPQGFKSRAGYSHSNEFQKFWIFLYEIASELRSNNTEYDPDKSSSNYQERPSSITIVADNIGLSGFIDDACMKIIHPGEPCQGVLLSNLRETLGNLKIIPIYQSYDSPLPIDNPDAPTAKPEEYRKKYQKYLAGRLKVRSVTILGTEYQTAIKNRLPFLIFVNDYTPYYIDRDGNKIVRGLDADKILTSAPDDDEYDDNKKTKRTAYINSLLNTKYSEVRPFGKYGGDGALAINSDDDSYTFINKEGQPDVTGIDVVKIGDSKTRAIYFNQLFGKEMYDSVGSFNDFGGQLAKAVTPEGNTVLVNKEGNQDISIIDVTKLTDSNTRALVINQKLGKNIYSAIGTFGQYGEGIAAAYKNNGENIFINTESKPSIKGINVLSINDSTLRAAYFNQKFKKKVFSFVGNFGKYGKTIAVAKYVGSEKLEFINALGQPAIDQIDINDISDANLRATFINQKYGTNFTSVGYFDKIGDDVAYAVDDDGNIEFINKEGKPSMGNVDINRIDDSHIRAVYVNKLLGTDYIHIGRFGELGGDVAFATNPEKMEYVFINREGKPDVTGVELDKIRDKATRAAYFNQKNGTNYESVGDFNAYTYGDNAAKAYEVGKGRFFINREGKPDTSGVDVDQFEDSYDRATYYNQKFGTNYDEVLPFGQYGKGITIANDAEGNRYFVNDKGKKSLAGVDVDSLNDTLRATYYNQKFKTDYKTMGNFGDYGENIAAVTTKDGKKLFINKQGKPDISGIDMKKLKTNSYLLAQYFNTINGTNYSDIITPSNNIKTNAMFATVPDGHIFVNSKGKPTLKITNIDGLIKYYDKNTIDDVIKLTKKAIKGNNKIKENYSPLHLLVNEEIRNYFQF